MLKTVFLCIILKGSDLSVNHGDLSKTKTSALGNSTSVAIPSLKSGVNESAKDFNSSSERVVTEILETNRSTVLTNTSTWGSTSVANSSFVSTVNENANGFSNISGQVVDEVLKRNRTTVLSNTSINVLTEGSVVITNSTGEGSITDSRNSPVLDEFLEPNQSMVHSNTSINASILGSVVMNNSTDVSNIIQNATNISDFFPIVGIETTLNSTINPSEWFRNISNKGKVNFTSSEAALPSENFADNLSPPGVLSLANTSMGAIATNSWVTNKTSNLSTFAERNLTVLPTRTPTILPVTIPIHSNALGPAATASANMSTNVTGPHIGLNQLVNRTKEEDHSAQKNTTSFSDPTELHITPPNSYATASPTSAVTMRPTYESSQSPTAFPIQLLNMKPEASTMTAEEGLGNSGSSWSDVYGDASSSSTKNHTGHRGLLIMTVILAILSILVVIVCTHARRWCLRKWYGYTEVDLTEETLEMDATEDVSLNESFDSPNERTFLKQKSA